MNYLPDDNHLNNLMEECLEINNYKTMKFVLDSCHDTYVNYEYYYKKLLTAQKEVLI